jgi:hypothetical protein
MLNKQMVTARNMKASFEERVLSLMAGTKRLRIQGAILEPASKKSATSLSWTGLEEALHKYYSTNKKTDETAAILAFLRDNRGSKSQIYLKKTALTEVPQNVIEDGK